MEKEDTYGKHFHERLFKSAIGFLLGFFIDVTSVLIEVTHQLSKHRRRNESFFQLRFLVISVTQRKANV